MDWDMKMAWEMSELDPNAEPSISSIRSNNLDCSVDLKLGNFGDFSLNEKWKDHHQRVPAVMTVSPSSTSKRARVPNSSSQNVSCLVEGCTADLSNCREYHKRHKVCEVHSKTPIVSVNGQEQRFCQQCSRFHLLVEFDEAKRSCRKRLDGHNRRRRKPQPDSISTGNLFASHQGSRFSSSYNQMFPATSTNSCWPMMIKSEEDPIFSQPHHQFSNSFPQSFKEIKNFPYLQDCHPPESSRELYSSRHAQDSSCALSLLSSPPLSHIIPDRLTNMPRPLFSYNASPSNMPVSNTVFSSPILDADNSNAEMNCNVLFDDVDGSCSEGGSQAIPFSWQQLKKKAWSQNYEQNYCDHHWTPVSHLCLF